MNGSVDKMWALGQILEVLAVETADTGNVVENLEFE